LFRRRLLAYNRFIPMGRRRRREQKVGVARAPARRSNWPLLLFLTGVFVVKAIVLWQLQHHPLLEPEGGVDSAEYVHLARRVLAGDLLLGPGLYYLSPLYVYFLAATLWVSDSLVFVRVAQIALGTAAVGLIFLTARDWLGERAAWLAAAMAALTGIFTFYEIVLFQSSIDVFLTAAALYCLSAASAGRRIEILAGVFLGLEFLNRPNVAIAIGAVVLVLLMARQWRRAALLAAGLAVAVTPLAARNAVVNRQFALTSSQGGLNFYIGNNPEATGQYAAVPGVRPTMAGQSEDTRRVAEAAVGHPLTDADVSFYYTRLGLDWIGQHPGGAAALFARKLALTFSAQHQWLDYSYPYYAHDTGSLLAALVVGPWLLVPLAFAGAALLLAGAGPSDSAGSGGLGSTRRGLIVIVFAAAYAVSVAAFFVAERYRLPLFVPLCILAGAGSDRLLQALRPVSGAQSRSSALPSTVTMAAVAVAGGVLAWWPHHLDDGRYAERLRLSEVLMNGRDYGGAVAELERALALRPGDTTTEFTLGMAQVSDGRAAEGLAHARHAVDAGVAVPGARYALVGAMLQTGDRDGAVARLRTYQPAPDDTAESCYQVALMALNAGAPRVAARYAQRALELRPGWPPAQDLISRIPR
jgi:4-amino-4-deoxy-L-arabinose transferase-like glycosyltransferase